MSCDPFNSGLSPSRLEDKKGNGIWPLPQEFRKAMEYEPVKRTIRVGQSRVGYWETRNSGRKADLALLIRWIFRSLFVDPEAAGHPARVLARNVQ